MNGNAPDLGKVTSLRNRNDTLKAHTFQNYFPFGAREITSTNSSNQANGKQNNEDDSDKITNERSTRITNMQTNTERAEISFSPILRSVTLFRSAEYCSFLFCWARARARVSVRDALPIVSTSRSARQICVDRRRQRVVVRCRCVARAERRAEEEEGTHIFRSVHNLK